MIADKTNSLYAVYSPLFPAVTILRGLFLTTAILGTPLMAAAHPVVPIQTTSSPTDSAHQQAAKIQAQYDRDKFIRESEEYQRVYRALLNALEQLKDANFRRVRSLQQLIQNNPHDPAPAMELASFYLLYANLAPDSPQKNSNYKEAAKAFTLVLERQPDNSQALLTRAFCYLQMEQYDEAIKGYSVFISKNPGESNEAYGNRAIAYFKTNQYQAALSDLTFVEKAPQDNRNYKLQGDCLVALGKYDEAVEAYKSILQHTNPIAAAEGYFLIGAARKRQGNLAAAYDAFGHYIKANPNMPQPYEERIQCVMGLRRFPDAVKECLLYEKRFPQDGIIYPYHADALLSMNDQDSYRQLCQRVIARVGTTANPSSANFAAWVCAIGPNGLKDYSIPLKIASRAIETATSMSETTSEEKERKMDVLWANRNTYATLLYRAGKYQSSIEQFKQCEAMPRNFNPGNRFADLIFLAMAYKKMNSTKAESSFKQAQDFLPTPSVEQKLFLREAKSLLSQ